MSGALGISTLCGGRSEYLHRTPGIRKRREKRERRTLGYKWATPSLGDINSGTWSIRLCETQTRVKYYYYYYSIFILQIQTSPYRAGYKRSSAELGSETDSELYE
jgi:hypothetical protein